MAVILRSPWAGHPAGARLTLSEMDERQLVRGGAADVAGDDVVTAPPVTKPAEPPRKRGRPRKAEG